MAATYRKAPPGTSTWQASRSRRRMLRRSAALFGSVTAVMLAAACGSAGGSTGSQGTGGGTGSQGAGGSSGSAASANVVSARRLSGVGTVLVNGSGMTIYSVKTPTEVNGNIKCTGSCLAFWFPVTAGSVNPGSSALPGKLSTVHRPGGKSQLTYNGMPLYTFKLDTAAGQANGNNVTDQFNGTTFRWQAVTASGGPASGGSPAPAPSYSSSGYGY